MTDPREQQKFLQKVCFFSEKDDKEFNQPQRQKKPEIQSNPLISEFEYKEQG